MVLVKHWEVDRFLNQNARAHALFLVFGPDNGLVRETSARVLAVLNPDRGNPFAFVDLDGDQLASDPQRLVDEANTISLFGEKRAIRVVLGARSISAAVEPLIETPSVDSVVVIEAGDLKPAHALRHAFEAARTAVCLACLEDDRDRLQRLIAEELGQRGYRLDPAATSALLDLLGADRAASRLELRKLADYMGTERTVTVGDIEAIVGDVSHHRLDRLIDAAFGGDVATVEREAGPLLRLGGGGQAVIAAALRLAWQLRATHATPGASGGTSRFSRRDQTLELRRHWPDAKLDRALAILGEAQFASRQRAALAASIVERALWSVALAARR